MSVEEVMKLVFSGGTLLSDRMWRWEELQPVDETVSLADENGDISGKGWYAHGSQVPDCNGHRDLGQVRGPAISECETEANPHQSRTETLSTLSRDHW